MIPILQTARELLAALGDLLLGLPRTLLFIMSRKRRLAEFCELDRATLEPLDPSPGTPLRSVWISCGDASAETHALHLVRHLQERHPNCTFRGFGGARLAAAGCTILEPLADMNVMGFRDVLAQLPLFLRCLYRFAKEIGSDRPDVVVLLDYPGLHRPMLRIARRAGVPVVDYIAPQLWAWAPWRVRDFRRADRLLTILPFEDAWYRARGANPQFVGHPLGDNLATAGEDEPTLPPLPEGPRIGILPGSRRREIEDNLPLLLDAAACLHARRPDLVFVLPHLRADLWPLLHTMLDAADVPVHPLPGIFHSILPHLQAAWVTSGTALLEVAAHRVPPVLLYRIPSKLGDAYRRHALSVPYIGSLNLIAERELAPEFVGRTLDPTALADALELRMEGPVREEILAELDTLRPLFAEPGAAARAAVAVEAAAAR